jgi:hypothetical protein
MGRLQLQSLLEEITENVYFQPPATLKMDYPCIRYERNGGNVRGNVQRAGNLPYRLAKRYQITVIDRNPDSTLPDQVEALAMCEFDRWFARDNLNHWVYNLFFERNNQE